MTKDQAKKEIDIIIDQALEALWKAQYKTIKK